MGEAMALSWLNRDENVNDLIAKQKYTKAIQILTTEFRQGRRDTRLRLQLADVLVLAGRQKEAVPILRSLAKGFAIEGFAAKAISVLKKVQRIDPRPDIDRELAALIKAKHETSATSTITGLVPPPSSSPATTSFDMEEIGMESIEEGLPSQPESAAEPEPASRPQALEPTPIPEPEIVAELDVVPVVDDAEAIPDIIGETKKKARPRKEEAVLAKPPAATAQQPPAGTAPTRKTVPPPTVVRLTPSSVVPQGRPVPVTSLPKPPASPTANTSEADEWELLGDELLAIIDEVLAEPIEIPGTPGGVPAGEIAASPLFSSFSQDELAAVIGGLELKTYDAGDIIITQGEKGSSLFVLTSGVAKAFVRQEDGASRLVREMDEGAFFGEISILSGKPRTATVTAKTPCELLELDRKRLDEITTTQPRVLDVLQEFYEQRIQTS